VILWPTYIKVVPFDLASWESAPENDSDIIWAFDFVIAAEGSVCCVVTAKI
jgi:hypothetical protein